MDSWIDGFMDRWIDVCIDDKMNCLDRWLDVFLDKWLDVLLLLDKWSANNIDR